MTLSQGLIRRLQSGSSDEPLPKRLKLAENVLYSPELAITHKENCILKWLCSELSVENASVLWTTIYRCLSTDPKTFAKLFPETKSLFIGKLIETFNQYPESYVSEAIVKCCPYVISNSHINCYSKENSVILLIKAVIEFTLKVLDSDNFDEEHIIGNSVLIECTEKAIGAFVQVCRQSSSEKKNFTLVFIEELFFPLASLSDKLKKKQMSSKIPLETEKCIKRLMLPSIKNTTTSEGEDNKNNNDTENVFNALKDAVEAKQFEEVAAAFKFVFQCSVNAFSQNSDLIDIILRRLVDCVQQKQHSQQILILLLESSVDVSYNFEHEIEGVTLKTYLKTHIEEIVSKSKHLKYSDYNLVAAIAKLNPIIVEDMTQSILGRIIFENKKHKKEEVAYDKCFAELWTGSVRLRRQQKFLSKLLITVVSFKEEKDSPFVDAFDLPETFISEFKKDLKTRTISAHQVIGMFHTLNFHLQSDCYNVLKESGPTTQVYLLIKIIAKIFVPFFENASFLDNSLPQEWQQKFHKAFSDLKDILSLLAETLSENTYSCEAVIFIVYFDLVKIWCEVHDLLYHYVPDLFLVELPFPINESKLKELKRVVKTVDQADCQKSLNEVIYFKSIIYNKGHQEPIKDKILFELWPCILENHFEYIGNMSDLQIFKLSEYLILQISSNENEFLKWSAILKMNIPRMSVTFTTSVALQIISNIANHIESSTTKSIIQSTDFEKVMQTLSNPDLSKKALKSTKKQIAKQSFESINECDVETIRRNLLFLSNLPVSFLDPNIRLFLLMILYTFDQETKNRTDFKELIHNLYYDFLRKNDIDITSSVSDPSILVEYFQDNHVLLAKIIKLSFNNSTSITFWESFIEKEEFNRKISSALLICNDGLKSKASHEHKTSLQNLAQKLSNKFVKNIEGKIDDCFEIAGLRISLKTVLAEKKKVKSNLKKCVELSIKNLIQNENNTHSEELAHEIIQLSLIVLSHREDFNIDDSVIKNICEIIIVNPDEKTFSHFLETLKDNEFGFFAEALNKQTGEHLVAGKAQLLDKIVTVWQSLAKVEAKASRSKSLCASLNNLLNALLASEVKDTSSLSLLKILRAFVTSKRLIHLNQNIIDSVFVLSMECLNRLDQQTIFISCQEALGLCLDFIRAKPEFVLDRLPILNSLFKKVFQIILHAAKATNFSDEQILRILAVDIEKFCSFYAKLKKEVARISPYLIADLIDISSRVGVLPSFLKVSIDFAISQLLSNCDRHAVSFLSRTMPTSTQQIFKTIYDNYVKYHKFTGKI